MKVARHEKIIELIQQHDIDTQEELAARLNEAGFKVTQATVSRDIRALKMTKVAGKDGKPHYAILNGTTAELGDKPHPDIRRPRNNRCHPRLRAPGVHQLPLLRDNDRSEQSVQGWRLGGDRKRCRHRGGDGSHVRDSFLRRQQEDHTGQQERMGKHDRQLFIHQ